MKKVDLSKALFLIPLLTGCGQTGPLYLPGAPAPIHVEKEKPQAPVAEEKTADEKTSTSENKP